MKKKSLYCFDFLLFLFSLLAFFSSSWFFTTVVAISSDKWIKLGRLLAILFVSIVLFLFILMIILFETLIDDPYYICRGTAVQFLFSVFWKQGEKEPKNEKEIFQKKEKNRKEEKRRKERGKTKEAKRKKRKKTSHSRKKDRTSFFSSFWSFFFVHP